MEQLRSFLSIDCDLLVPKTNSQEELLELAKDVDVIFGPSVSGRVIRAARNLRFIQCSGAGIDNKVDFDALKGRDIYVSTQHTHAIAVAEHAMALILALAKNLLKMDEFLRTEPQKWLLRPSAPFERDSRWMSLKLYGRTLGLVGVGHIGEQIAIRAKAFGMRVIGIKRHPSKELMKKLGMDFLEGPDKLDYVLENSDIIVICVPLTSETRDLIGKRELDLCGATYIINVSRGQILNEKALCEALESRKLKGAGIDAWYYYPPDPRAPSVYSIHKMENVLGTPHIAGWTPELNRRILRFVAENIERVARGEKPKNLVDLESGY